MKSTSTLHPSRMPPEMWYGYGFAFCHSMSFPLLMGTTMLLYFKRLGASVTMLAVVAALESILQVLQIPVARLIEQVGYKTFMLKGFAVRFAMAGLMALVAWIPLDIKQATRMYSMLLVVIGYQLLRISSSAYFPWIAQLWPEKVSGHYIIRDKICSYMGILIVMILSAFYLQNRLEPSDFAPVFAFGLISGVVSLFFLKYVPDAPIPKHEKDDGKVTWVTPLAHKPFREFLLVNFLTCTTVGVGTTFWVPFLKDVHHLSDSNVLLLSVLISAVSVVNLFFLTKFIDQFDHRAIFEMSLALLGLQYAGWCLIATGLIPVNFYSLLLQGILSALGLSIFSSMNIRIMMSLTPQKGRSHFFALFLATINITMGLFPMLWGPMIDYFKDWSYSMSFWNWNIYVVLYLFLALTVMATGLFGPSIREGRRMGTRLWFKDLLTKTPRQVLSYLSGQKISEP